jgi:hypothetical protein
VEGILLGLDDGAFEGFAEGLFVETTGLVVGEEDGLEVGLDVPGVSSNKSPGNSTSAN